MSTIDNLLMEINEGAISREVGLKHDDARNHYQLRSNVVTSYDEFTRTIGDYYNFHVSFVRGCGLMAQSDAQAKAKRIVEQAYRRNNGDIISAFRDASDSVNSGMRGILDKIAETLKFEDIEDYIKTVFDRYVQPASWEQKVEIIGQFIRKYGPVISSLVEVDRPEQYAQNYQELIRLYMENLRRCSSVFRRL
jgi:hypothetical protein